MITLTLKMQFNEKSDAEAAKQKILATTLPGLVTYTEVSYTVPVVEDDDENVTFADAMNAMIAATPLKWTREHAGRYLATRDGKELVVREYVKGDWELTVNGQHQGYAGTKRAAQLRAERFLKGEQW